MSLNKVMLIGNVGRDPEIRYLDGNAGSANATKVASFTLATTERYRDRNGETRENTEWHNIVAWRNSADIAEKYIRKGTQIYVEGKLRTRSWTDSQGVKKYTTEINVDSLQLLGRRGDNPDAGQSGSTWGGNSQQAPYSQGSGYGQQGQYSQPAGFQPRQAAPAPAPQPVAQPSPAIDIMDDGSDDLPF